KVEGYPIMESDLRHLSPARFEHINPYGKYRFDIDKELQRKELRPLRKK
ncbi:MAG: Tn3 family transposase, partial [Candidatus Poribacteria bacterium]|nr:Tn3 family transposase [Candidatus Poribacteria bacterium]